MQITRNISGTHHMQYVMYYMVRSDSPATKFDLAEIALILALLSWLKSLTNEGGEETGVPNKKKTTLTTSFRNLKIQAPTET